MASPTQWLKRVSPEWAWRRLKALRAGVRYPGRSRYCPCCGRWVGRFQSFGDPVREDAQCPSCGSLERHRLQWLYLTGSSVLRSSRRVLHLAPEPAIAWPLRREQLESYVTSDLGDLEADVIADLTRSPFASGAFDLVLCSHVLEHIPDDRNAMMELRRIVGPAGLVLVQVPMRPEAVTDEDPSVVDPVERRRRFGQADHVRMYGRDVIDRLRETGFDVSTFSSSDLDPENAGLCALGSAEPLLVCRPVADRGGGP